MALLDQVATTSVYRGQRWYEAMDKALLGADKATWCVLQGTEKGGGRTVAMRTRDQVMTTMRLKEAMERTKLKAMFWDENPLQPDEAAQVYVGFREIYLVNQIGGRDETPRMLCVIKCPRRFGCDAETGQAKVFGFILGRHVSGREWAKRVFYAFLDRNLREDHHRLIKDQLKLEKILMWKRFSAFKRMVLIANLAARFIAEIDIRRTPLRRAAIEARETLGALPERDWSYRILAGIAWLLFKSRSWRKRRTTPGRGGAPPDVA